MAKISDAERFAEIYDPYIEQTAVTFEETPLTKEDFENRIETITQRYPWIVYEEEGKVLGYAYLSAFNPRSAYDWTADLAIYVDMDAHGKGIGTKLMETIIDLASKDGYMWLVSIVTQSNGASQSIHERFGFEKKAAFDDFGYKLGKWTGVDFYVRKLNELTDTPQKPKNLTL